MYYIPLYVSSTVCSSSGGQICIKQHLVSSHTTHLFRCDDIQCCIIQFWPPDDEHVLLETCRGIWYIFINKNLCTFLGSLRSSLHYNSELASSNFSISYLRVYCRQIVMQLRLISNGCVISFVPQEIHIMKILLLCSKIREFLRLLWIFIPIWIMILLLN